MRWLAGLLTVPLLVLAFAPAGCDWQQTEQSAEKAPTAEAATGQSPVGTVAVIDLDRLARELGIDRQMAQAIKQREQSLNQKLAVVKASFDEQIELKAAEFGEQPTREQESTVADYQRQAHQQLNEYRSQAQSDLNQYQQQVIVRFRREVRPVAQQVAAERGLSMVVTRNDSVVFSYQESVDITDAVAEQLSGVRIEFLAPSEGPVQQRLQPVPNGRESSRSARDPSGGTPRR